LYRKNQKMIAVLLLLFFALGICGCQDKARRPIADKNELAPEVVKYDKEPTISLYRKKADSKEDIKLEKYIQGVVAAEIGDKFPAEVLKAQAVLARTMTLALMEYQGGTQGKHGTDASDDHTEFQAYNPDRVNDKIVRAVEDTQGQVLTYEGKFAYTFFHAASHKSTASIEEGFPKFKEYAAAYIVPVKTNGLKAAPEKYTNWTVKVPAAEIKKIMGANAELAKIKISEKGPTGRALMITAGPAKISALTLREKVGFDKLYSTMFSSIKLEGDNVVFKGNGWGHGCGMDQWGASVMADEQKNSARQIIEHYYPNTKLVTLY
jgi:stage II sporulation protein D